MDACLAAGVHYMDTANYEPRDEARFEYSGSGPIRTASSDAGLMALLGSGFDPGVTSVFAMWLKKHKLKTDPTRSTFSIATAAITARHFATNFNPEINIREVTAPARHWENGEWVKPLPCRTSRASISRRRPQEHVPHVS
jgi:saccharopine dehydrogenase (NAD+, L-lysine-forming)